MELSLRLPASVWGGRPRNIHANDWICSAYSRCVCRLAFRRNDEQAGHMALLRCTSALTRSMFMFRLVLTRVRPDIWYFLQSRRRGARHYMRRAPVRRLQASHVACCLASLLAFGNDHCFVVTRDGVLNIDEQRVRILTEVDPGAFRSRVLERSK